MAEKKSRTTAKKKFTLERKGLKRAIDDDEPLEIIHNSFAKLSGLWNEVKDLHET